MAATARALIHVSQCRGVERVMGKGIAAAVDLQHLGALKLGGTRGQVAAIRVFGLPQRFPLGIEDLGAKNCRDANCLARRAGKPLQTLLDEGGNGGATVEQGIGRACRQDF